MTTAYQRLRASVDRVMPIRPDDLIEVRAADVDALLTDYAIAIAERDSFSDTLEEVLFEKAKQA